ncbi:MAG: hypothetical protein IID39_06805, partial [Planctomycetes bacterium]|nr:hypothetical protein [Planctomycetota bacterium]
IPEIRDAYRFGDQPVGVIDCLEAGDGLDRQRQARFAEVLNSQVGRIQLAGNERPHLAANLGTDIQDFGTDR